VRWLAFFHAALLHNIRDAAIRLSETVKTGEGQQWDICLDDN